MRLDNILSEQPKKRSMTADITSKMSENPKKKKQIWHSDEGKQLSEDTVWISGKCGPAITVHRH